LPIVHDFSIIRQQSYKKHVVLGKLCQKFDQNTNSWEKLPMTERPCGKLFVPQEDALPPLARPP